MQKKESTFGCLADTRLPTPSGMLVSLAEGLARTVSLSVTEEAKDILGVTPLVLMQIILFVNTTIQHCMKSATLKLPCLFENMFVT